MTSELDCVTDRRARKAIIEAGYDTLEKAHEAGEGTITDLKYVGKPTWKEIVAEWTLRERAVAAELDQADELGDPPPGEPAELPLPPVISEPPPGDPQEVPEDLPPMTVHKVMPGTFEHLDEDCPCNPEIVNYDRPLGAIPESEVKEPDAGGEIVRDDCMDLATPSAPFDSQLSEALAGRASLEAAYEALEESLNAQRQDGIGNLAGIPVDELMRSYVACLTLLRNADKAHLLQALLMGWIRQAVDLGLVPDVSEWVWTSKASGNPSRALAALLPYEQVYLEPPAEPWPVR